MKIVGHNIAGIRPVSRSGGAKTRRGRNTDADDAAFDRTDAVAARLPAVVPGSAGSARSGPADQRPGIAGTVVAQLLAQRSRGKSDRRLARYFPERVHQAYQRAAEAPRMVQTGSQRSV